MMPNNDSEGQIFLFALFFLHTIFYFYGLILILALALMPEYIAVRSDVIVTSQSLQVVMPST